MALILPQPILQLTINGDIVSSAFMSDVLSFTYTDEFHGKSDSIDIELQDANGLYRAKNGPQKHDIIEASIGYVGGVLLPCGQFECDAPKGSGSRGGDKFTIQATSTATSKKLRTLETKAFENQKLSEIVKQELAEAGLSHVGDIEDISYTRITRRRERRLQFLKRIAEDTGHYFAVKGTQAVFTSRESIEEQASSHLFSLIHDDFLKSWDMTEETAQTYSTAKVQYKDSLENRLLEALAKDDEVETGDELVIKERVENEEQAQRLAEARLKKANDIKMTGSLDLVGMTSVISGLTIGLDNSFGRYEGKYLAGPTRHSITRSQGYSTSADIKRVGDL